MVDIRDWRVVGSALGRVGKTQMFVGEEQTGHVVVGGSEQGVNGGQEPPVPRLGSRYQQKEWDRG